MAPSQHAIRQMPDVHGKTGHPRCRRHLADGAAYGTVYIETAAEPSQGWGWKGMERSMPAPRRVLGQVVHRGWVRGVLGARFTVKPISRCFRNTSYHLPRAQVNGVLQQEVTRHSTGDRCHPLHRTVWLWAEVLEGCGCDGSGGSFQH